MPGQGGIHSFVIDFNNAIARKNPGDFGLVFFNAFLDTMVVLNDKSQGRAREDPLEGLAEGCNEGGSGEAASSSFVSGWLHF